MGKKLQIGLGITFLLLLQGCLKEVKEITNSDEYNLVYHSLLNGSYDAQGQEGLEQELKEIDEWDVNGGPYSAKMGDEKYYIVLMIDTRKEESQHKCYLFAKSKAKIKIGGSKTLVTRLSCSKADSIIKNLPAPEFTDYKPLSRKGKEVLTLIAEGKWGREREVPIRFVLSEGGPTGKKTKVITFSISEYLKMRFNGNLEKVDFSSQAKGFEGRINFDRENIDVQGREKISSNHFEFILWLSFKTGIFSQEGRKISMASLNPSYFYVEEIRDLIKLDENDELGILSQVETRIKNEREFIHFQYMKLKFNPEEEDILEVEFHMLSGEQPVEKRTYYLLDE